MLLRLFSGTYDPDLAVSSSVKYDFRDNECKIRFKTQAVKGELQSYEHSPGDQNMEIISKLIETSLIILENNCQ